MALLQHLKNIFGRVRFDKCRTYFCIIGIASVAFIVFSIFNFIPPKAMDTLPRQIQEALIWTGHNGFALLAIFSSLVAAYVVLKLVVWLKKRENRNFGGLLHD
jgi:hypothetical protein